MRPVVDGTDLFAGARRGDYVGFKSAEMFGDAAPLLPREAPRRVAVYRCNCSYAECEAITCRIEEQAGRIYWSDFRSFSGVFYGPLARDITNDGRALDIPDLTFASSQYLAEVRRATAVSAQSAPPQT